MSDAVVFYCDKNGGVGTVCCPTVAWHALHDKLWANTDYRHIYISPSSLQSQHYARYIAGKWNTFSSFRKSGTPANDPFVIVKYKDLNKYRPMGRSVLKHKAKIAVAGVWFKYLGHLMCGYNSQESPSCGCNYCGSTT